MIKIKQILRLLAITFFCIVMISSFWATAGGWTQRYLENIFNKVSNNDSYNNTYVTNNNSHYQTVASAAQNGDLRDFLISSG
jgi:outer membrane lipoprotein-sorting protein